MKIIENMLTKQFIGLLLCLFYLPSCKKYLDAKPDKQLVVPSTVADLQGLLDYHFYMNDKCSIAPAIAADNYYLTDQDFSALSADRMRRAYLWGDRIFEGASPTDWQNEYTIVYNANVVLENIKKIQQNTSNRDAWNNCKGSALVYRAKSFYEIAQIWAKAYDSITATTDLGIPLRLSPDFNIKSKRATVTETYGQIISDLKMALPLLPDMPIFPYRPSKCAAYGLLARTYLVMRNYTQAKLYADSCLLINDKLLDYNSLDTTSRFSFSPVQFTNPEDIMHSSCSGANSHIIPYNATRVDSSLYNTYSGNDLRKNLFFEIATDGSVNFKGSYDGGSGQKYNGIATDEIFLIRAECYARLGMTSLAMKDLNTLMHTRWETGTFVPFYSTNAQSALNIILQERRKELVFRMLRFSDIKRLNKEGANIVQKRIINGNAYILNPNSQKYALPIPENVIQYTGMKQN